MKNEINVIKPEQFGLEKKQALTIEEAFLPKMKEGEILSNQYSELIKKDITHEVCDEATRLGRKLVKVRTGIADVHRTQKAFFYAAGKFVDAKKNKETLPITQMEEGVKKIKNHFAEIEEAKREVIRKERNAELEKYEIEYGMGDIAFMTPDVWKHFLSGVKSEFEEKKAEEARVEKERIEDNKKQDLFVSRKEKLIQFSQFGIYEKLTIDTSEKEFIAIVEEGEKAKIDFDKKQAAIKSENDRLKRLSIVREKKEKELKLRNSKRNEELRSYIVFIRDYSGLLNAEEKEYQKQLKDIKAGAELQWESDRKEQQRKVQEEEYQKEKEIALNKSGKARHEMLSEVGVKLDFQSCKNMDEDVWNEFYDDKNKIYQSEQNRIFTQKLKAEADRKAELAPDKERMTKWISDMTIIDIVNDRMSKESALVASEIIDKYNKFKTWATEKVNEIK